LIGEQKALTQLALPPCIFQPINPLEYKSVKTVMAEGDLASIESLSINMPF
jgi:hypothetical protein